VDLSERGAATARHPWEVVRAEFFRNLIASSADLPRIREVVDVGAGDGWFAQEMVPMLDDAARVTCWDINYSADDLVADLPTGVLRTATRPTTRAQLVTLLDVIEHVPDDRSFLRDEVAPLLTDDGRLIVSVPAHPALYSQHDAALHHERRYTRREFLTRLRESFTVIDAGSLFTSLLAPRVVEVAAEKAGRTSPERGIGGWQGGTVLTAAVTGALRLDARAGRLAARVGLPVPGLSLWAVCRPGGDR
jgi:SAM-dependent methyltransferase